MTFHFARLLAALVGAATGLSAQSTAGNANPREFVKPALTPSVYFFAAANPTQANLYKRPGSSSPYDLLASFPIAAGLSGPSELTAADSDVFFAADAGSGTGDELWTSNGTPIGTFLVKDIRVGPLGSKPQQLTNFRPGMFLFTADDGVNGRELWLTDGTNGGTQMVKDIFLGPTGSAPQDFFVVGTQAFFSASDSASGRELWVTDGTGGGTVRVTEIAAGAIGSHPSSFALLGTDLIYAADDAVTGNELWKTDVNTLSTSQVADIHPSGSSHPDELTPAHGKIYFAANDGSTGSEVWETDGTPTGTVLAANIGTFVGMGSNPYGFRATSSSLWFGATSAGAGTELWHIDNLGAVSQIADLNVGPASSMPQHLTVFGTDLLFTATTPPTGRELFRATGGGAVLVRDIKPGICDSGINSLAVPDSVAMMAADSGQFGHELYESAGTFGSTGLVAEINLALDDQPDLDVSHGPVMANTQHTFKISDAEPGASAFVMLAARAATPFDPGPLLGLQTHGAVTIDLGAFFFSLGPAVVNASGIAMLPPLVYPTFGSAFELVSQGLTFTATSMEFTGNLSMCQGSLDMSGVGCPPGTFVKLEGEYVDDRLDYCLSINPSSSDVQWVVIVKINADGSCKELMRKKLTGSAITLTIVESLKLGEYIEARFYCGKPNDDCSVNSGYVACRLGC